MDSWVQFSIALIAVLSAAVAILRYIIRAETKSLKSEVTANGGDSDSLGDRVMRLESSQQRLEFSQQKQTESLARLEQSNADQKKINDEKTAMLQSIAEHLNIRD